MNRLNDSVLNENEGNITSFFAERFGSQFLPSHNLDHHLRVWIYAVGIIKQLRELGFQFSDDFLSGLQIASLTHDIGLATDRSETHGKANREVVEQYPLLKHLPLSIREEVLFSIENHDRKDYVRVSPPESMLTILSVADDLDAFGYIGVYRYIEIYLERGIRPDRIGEAVTENLATRFIHLNRVYGFLSGFVDRHAIRFEITRDFFNPEGPYPGSVRRKIIDIIGEELLKKHKDIAMIVAGYKSDSNHDIALFFNSLNKELLMAEYV